MKMNGEKAEPKTIPLMASTSGFQRDIVRALDDLAPCNGLDVMKWLEALYDADVHYGRLYPNLDELVAEGLVEKREREHNGRDNEYRLTTDGQQLLEAL